MTRCARCRVRWVVAVAALPVAAAAYRHWHLRWGATDAEVRAPMAGDDLLLSSQFTCTRAIDIAAPPEQVWPWLAQVGVGRAGFYSYDLLDNRGRPSADYVMQRWQHPQVGEIAAPMVEPIQEGMYFRVHLAEEPHRLVWAKDDSTWSWQLTPTPDGGTRLVTRLRQRYDVRSPELLVTVPLLEIGDFPMMRRMLRGIRERAEAETGAAADA